MARASSIPYISLFSGAMGLDLGLERAGFNMVVANENDPGAIKTIRKNKPRLPLLECGIETLSINDFNNAAGKNIKNIPLIVGGPPCQAFSIMGRRKGLADERGTLIYEFIRIIGEARPDVFVMENVRGLLSMSILPPSTTTGNENWKKKQGSLFKHILYEFSKIGYRVDTFIVNSANYGAPQVRERVICIGNRHNHRAIFPQPQYSNRPEDGLPKFITLREVIGNNFVDTDTTLMNFSPRKLNYLSMVPPGGNWRSLPIEVQKKAMGKQYYLKGGRSSSWRRLSWDYPSPTVHTLPNHATTSMCHPGELRALTVGECAAIQEFPKTWKIEGTPSERYRQVGNAVPVRLGEITGFTVRQLLADINNKKSKKSSPILPHETIEIRPHVRVRSWWKDGEALSGNFDYGKSKVSKKQEFDL